MVSRREIERIEGLVRVWVGSRDVTSMVVGRMWAEMAGWGEGQIACAAMAVKRLKLARAEFGKRRGG